MEGKNHPNLSLLNICLFLLSNAFAQSKRPLCEAWLAAGRQQAMSPPHSLVLLHEGWQTGEKQPRAGVPCLKSGFQPCPCSPYRWPSRPPLPHPCLQFPFQRSDSSKASLPLLPCCSFSPPPPHPPSPFQALDAPAGTGASAGPQSFLLSVRLWFWFPHSGQIETRLCGENVRQKGLGDLGEQWSESALPGWGWGAVPCLLRAAPSGPPACLVLKAGQVHK